MRISEVDPADEATLRAFWEAEQAALRHDREHAIPRTWDRLRDHARKPNDWYYARTLLVARDGDGVVGAADLGPRPPDNLHLADLEVNVRPERRREGIGRALYDEASAGSAPTGAPASAARSTCRGGRGAGDAGVRFATGTGLRAACTARTT